MTETAGSRGSVLSESLSSRLTSTLLILAAKKEVVFRHKAKGSRYSETFVDNLKTLWKVPKCHEYNSALVVSKRYQQIRSQYQ